MTPETSTPRTDAIAHRGYNESAYIAEMTDLARELERELNEITESLAFQKQLSREVIALETRASTDLATWESELSKVMPPDFKDWWQNSKSEWPLVARLVIESKTEWGEMIDAEVGTLREELAAITREEGELWELRQTNATMKENLVTLSHLHAKEAEKWQAAYYAERALADRLAGELQSWGDYCGDSAPASIDLALALWKEARK